MRLWHIDLIPYLPRQQLLAQWRECVCIAKNLAEKGTPNHILVNKILDYPDCHFVEYINRVSQEMKRRGYKVNLKSVEKTTEYVNVWSRKWVEKLSSDEIDELFNKYHKIFECWHNRQYLTQCFYNLQEKYDCGGMSEEEYTKLKNGYHSLIVNDNYSVAMNFSKEEFAQYLHNVQTEAVRNQRAKEVDEWMCFLDKDPRLNVRK